MKMFEFVIFLFVQLLFREKYCALCVKTINTLFFLLSKSIKVKVHKRYEEYTTMSLGNKRRKNDEMDHGRKRTIHLHS